MTETSPLSSHVMRRNSAPSPPPASAACCSNGEPGDLAEDARRPLVDVRCSSAAVNDFPLTHATRIACRASAKYQIARHLTRAASPGKIPLHGQGQCLRSVRRGGDRRADSHGRNHGGRRVDGLCRHGRASVRPRDVRPKAEPRKNESQAVCRRPPSRRDPAVVRRPEP